VVNAIDDLNGGSLDVYFNGSDTFPDIAAGQALPSAGSAATYTPVPSGSDTIQAYPHGASSGGLFSNPGANETLNGSTQYTVLLGGQYGITAGTSAPNLWVLTDNNTAPATGYLEVRVIDGSLWGNQNFTSGFDIFLVPYGTIINPSNPSFSGLSLGQSTGYLSLQAFSSGYTLAVAPTSDPSDTFFSQNYTSVTTGGQIFTIVLVDNNSNQPNGLATPLLLTDLN
jgi:hypothetical protein